jgi:hypothetical protein
MGVSNHVYSADFFPGTITRSVDARSSRKAPDDEETRMKPQNIRRSRLPLTCIACGLMHFAVPARADASCDPVYDAGIKQMKTPHHVFTNRSAHGRTAASTNETIFAGGVIYVQLRGQWQRSPIAAAEMLQHAQEKRDGDSSDETCRPLGDEAIDGTATVVYSLHNDAGADSRLWVTKANGLLLRQTVTLPDGSSIDSRYDYANVQAPAGVR